MFTVTKRIEIAAAHKLDLPYDSPCSKLHGHNWIITVEISAEGLNKEGMVIDFDRIGGIVRELDHENVTDVLEGLNSTAENIAKWVSDKLNNLLYHRPNNEYYSDIHVTKITVQESEGNMVCYTP